MTKQASFLHCLSPAPGLTHNVTHVTAWRDAGSELVHVIGFLLQMGFRQVGVPFPLASLNPLEANIAAHLSQLGLLAPFRFACLHYQYLNAHKCMDTI